MKFKMILTLILLFLITKGFAAAQEIVMWHAFEGFLYEKFNELVEDFNHQSSSCQIKLVYQGNYRETFDNGVEAFELGKPPHILQVYEVATQTMMMKPEMFRSAEELMRAFYKKFDPAIYIDAVREFYATSEGEMYSLPWNASTGILFYNKEAFVKAGLDPGSPPKTWEQMEKMGKKLVEAGFTGFTTAWPAAYHLEFFCAWHNIPFATQENGFKGLNSRLIFNSPYPVRHLNKLAEWAKEGIFSYQGRFTKEPEELFASGRCAILLQGANRLPVLERLTKKPIGVGFFPYCKEIPGAPYNLNIGGSSFWALKGFDEESYRGIAQFFAYLSLPEVQAWWHQQTGYLPITESAYYLTKKKGFYEKHPAAEIAVCTVMQSPTPFTKGIRLGDYPVIRDKIIDYLEKAIHGEMSGQEALDGAVREGNQILADFQKEHT